MLKDIKASTSFGPVESIRQDLHRTKNVMKCVYDFSKLGGAVGTIGLLDDFGVPAKLPKGAIVTKAYLDVLSAPTSGGLATVALQAEAAGDLLAATAIASITGLVDGKPDNTAAHMAKTTVDNRQVSAVIAVAALTGGKFNVFVEYVIGN